MLKQNFPRGLRLLTPVQFKYVFQDPLRASSPEITILARKNHSDVPRLGLAIPKKHLKRAHERNRVKRLCREYFRLHQNELPPYDFVVIARAPIGRLDNANLTNTLHKLWQRHIRLAQKSVSPSSMPTNTSSAR